MVCEFFQNEIFASRHQDENSVACIEDKCYVLTLAQYCRWAIVFIGSLQVSNISSPHILCINRMWFWMFQILCLGEVSWGGLSQTKLPGPSFQLCNSSSSLRAQRHRPRLGVRLPPCLRLPLRPSSEKPAVGLNGAIHWNQNPKRCDTIKTLSTGWPQVFRELLLFSVFPLG